MKVLLLISNFKPFKYPTDQVLGGMEMVELQQIKALLELGVDLHLAISNDSQVEELPHIVVPTTSSVNGNYYLSRVIDELDKHVDSFDFVLTNKNLTIAPTSARFEKLKRWAPKLRTINHITDDFPGSWSGVNNLMLNKALIPYGLRHAHVSAHAESSWNEYAEKILDGRSFKAVPEYAEFLKAHPGPSSTDHYEVMVVDDSFLPIDQIGAPEKYLFAARPCPMKGGHLVAGALKKIGLLSQAEFFCSPPAIEKEHNNLKQMLEIYPDIKVGLPHSLLMEAYCRAKAYVLPTSVETAGGITTFEAAAHGVPVVTSSIWSDRYLEPYGLLHKLEKRTEACVRKTLIELDEHLSSQTVESRRAIAEKVRRDFSWSAYKAQLSGFLQ